jgi:cupin superfamily acireductone dioxygenase involved in methionine salvage
MKIHLTYILLLLALVVALLYFYDQNRKHMAESSRKDSVIAEKEAEIKYHVSVTGRMTSEKRAAEATTKEAMAAYNEVIEEIKREFDVKAKDIKAFVSASFRAQGSGTGTTIIHNHYDSASRLTIIDSAAFNTDQDKFLKFNVTYYPGKAKFSPYHYTYSDEILMAFHAKKRWKPFGKEEIFASASFGNPNSMVTNQTSVLIKEARDKRWSLGMSAGWGLLKVGDEVHTGFFLGPSVHYALFKF